MRYNRFRCSSRSGATLLTLLAGALAGCATARATTYRDGAYTGTAFSKIAVFATHMTPEQALGLETQVCATLSAVSCAVGSVVLPPGRGYTGAEVERTLAAADVDGVLTIQPGYDRDAAEYFRYLPTRPAAIGATQHGNLALLGRTQPQSSSSSPDSRRAQAALMDRGSSRLVWGGDVAVDSRWGAPVSTHAVNAAMSKELVAQLRAAGLLR